jgi:hypothetical protein
MSASRETIQTDASLQACQQQVLVEHSPFGTKLGLLNARKAVQSYAVPLDGLAEPSGNPAHDRAR